MEIAFLLREVPLEAINPYDGCHMKDEHGWHGTSEEDTEEHERGIEWTRGLMRQGKEIRPILIFPVVAPDYKYQRLDGFKRYMAHKREGKETIRCVIVDEYIPGGQHGLSQVIE